MLLESDKTKPIIQSLLWTDLYKITMGQVVFHHYPNAGASYEFINRGKHIFPQSFGKKLEEQVEMMADVSPSASDRHFLETKCPYLTPDYLDYFSNYRFNPQEVKISQKEGELNIVIDDLWKRSIYWEVPLMALICELYYQETNQHPTEDYVEKAKRKGERLRNAGALLLEFGTRRAFSHEIHRNVLGTLIETGGRIEDGGILLGTSNVALAKEFGLNPSGTFAHEWVMAHAAMFGYKMANEKAMEVWAKEYLGLDGGSAYPRLGTALTDTFTTDVFIRSFNENWANIYSFLRQDSGDPFAEGNKLLNAWRKYFLHPEEYGKGTVFSDGLNTNNVLALHQEFGNLEADIYGVGTHLTNDCGPEPMNHVIKAFSFTIDGVVIPVCKLSDSPGKESGNPGAIEQAKKELGLL